MASSPWSSSPAAAPAPVPPPSPAAFDLRPLSLGELLDRIFAVYRAHFWLFAGIASVPALLQMLLGGVQVWIMHAFLKGMAPTQMQIGSGLSGSVLGIAVFLLFAVMHAATAYSVSEVYLGRTATVGGSIRAIAPRWLRYIGIAIWQTLSMLWPALLGMALGGIIMATRSTSMVVLGGFLFFAGAFGGLIGGFIFYLRNSLGVPASVVEGLTVRQSMRRSKVLTQGTKGRIFVTLLISGVLYMVAGMLQIPLAAVVVQATLHQQDALWAQALNLFIGFLSTSVVSPVAMIGLSLLYFDQRVRREAFDIEFLLGAAGPEPPASEVPVSFTEPAWTPPAQARFVTADAPQHEPSDAVYAGLVSAPRAEAGAEAGTEASAAEPAVTETPLPPGEPDHASGL